MTTKFFIVLITLLTVNVLADGPVIETTPYSRGVLQSQNSAQAQTALGFTGNDTSAVTMGSVSNWALGAVSANIMPNASNAILSATAQAVALPYNGYTIGARFRKNFLAGKVTRVVFTHDSYAGDCFGNYTNSQGGVTFSAYPWSRGLANAFYQGAYNLNANGSASSSFALPPAANPGNQWAVFPAYFNSGADGDPAYFGVDGTGHLLNCPLAGIWWGIRNGGQESYGPYTNASCITICWWQWPMGGNNLLVYTNGPSGPQTLMTTLNGFSSASTTNSAATNFYVPTGTYTIELTTTATGANTTNMLYGATAYNTNSGVVCFFAACGGTTVQQALQSMPLYSNFLAVMSPDITFFLDKHLNSASTASTLVPQLYGAMNGAYLTNSLWALVGSAEESTPAAADAGAYISEQLHDLAVSSNWTYLDLHYDNYTWTNLLSWDTIHPNIFGQAEGTATLLQQMGFQAGADPASSLVNRYIGGNAWRTNFAGVLWTNSDGTLRLSSAGGNNSIYLGSGGLIISNQPGGANLQIGFDDGVNPAVVGNSGNVWAFPAVNGAFNIRSKGGSTVASFSTFSGQMNLQDPRAFGDFINFQNNGNQIAMNCGNTGPNWSLNSIAVNPNIGLPGGYAALTSETNGVAEVFSNLIVNDGDILNTNGSISTHAVLGRSVAAGAIGITNTLTVNLRAWMASGFGIQLTNFSTGFHVNFGNENSETSWDLEPGEAIWGSGIVWVTNIAF